MDVEQNQGLDFDSSNLLLFIFRWKKPLTILTLAAATLSAIFSAPMFITPKFESTVIMFPTSTASISKSLLAKNNPSKEDLLSFGEEEQAEQLIQILNSDEIRKSSGKIKFKTNHAGGILGGISTGQDIVASFAVKPTSSILTSRETIDKKGKNTKISVKGRHDPCVGIRAVPIGEAMINCVLLDHLLMHRAQCG